MLKLVTHQKFRLKMAPRSRQVGVPKLVLKLKNWGQASHDSHQQRSRGVGSWTTVLYSKGKNNEQ